MSFISCLVIANSITNIVVCSLVGYICFLGIKKAKKDNQKKNNIAKADYKRK